MSRPILIIHDPQRIIAEEAREELRATSRRVGLMDWVLGAVLVLAAATVAYQFMQLPAEYVSPVEVTR